MTDLGATVFIEVFVIVVVFAALIISIVCGLHLMGEDESAARAARPRVGGNRPKSERLCPTYFVHKSNRLRCATPSKRAD